MQHHVSYCLAYVMLAESTSAASRLLQCVPELRRVIVDGDNFLSKHWHCEHRELLGTLFTVQNAPEGPPMDEVRLRPGGSFPIRDQEPPRPIPNGPPGVPRDGNHSSWKEHDNSWRSPFKGDLALLYPGL